MGQRGTCIACFAVLLFLSPSAEVVGRDRAFGSNDDLAWPTIPRGGGSPIYFQVPILDEEYLSSWTFPFLPADSECDLSPWCGGSQQNSVAVGHPMDPDVAPEFIRFDEVVVWGVYDGGAPPSVDSFRVLARRPLSGPQIPFTIVCDESGIAGTREIVGSVFGKDVYRHVLKLARACRVTDYVGHDTISSYYIEVFNSTETHGDWLWLAGSGAGSGPPFYRTFTYHAPSTPGGNFSLISEARAFEIYTSPAGATSDLRIARLPGGELRLEWAPDCGGADRYSVYRGDLGAGYESLAPEPGLCEVSGEAVEIEAGEGTADFFLVVPYSVRTSVYPPYWWSYQGSYGADSDGNPRPQPTSDRRCAEQGTPDSCAP